MTVLSLNTFVSFSIQLTVIQLWFPQNFLAGCLHQFESELGLNLFILYEQSDLSTHYK